MASSIFGFDYANILDVFFGAQAIMIDQGSFADTGEDPPLGFTATSNEGALLVGGSYAAIVGVMGVNPNPPSHPTS